MHQQRAHTAPARTTPVVHTAPRAVPRTPMMVQQQPMNVQGWYQQQSMMQPNGYTMTSGNVMDPRQQQMYRGHYQQQPQQQMYAHPRWYQPTQSGFF